MIRIDVLYDGIEGIAAVKPLVRRLETLALDYPAERFLKSIGGLDLQLHVDAEAYADEERGQGPGPVDWDEEPARADVELVVPPSVWRDRDAHELRSFFAEALRQVLEEFAVGVAEQGEAADGADLALAIDELTERFLCDADPRLDHHGHAIARLRSAGREREFDVCLVVARADGGVEKPYNILPVHPWDPSGERPGRPESGKRLPSSAEAGPPSGYAGLTEAEKLFESSSADSEDDVRHAFSMLQSPTASSSTFPGSGGCAATGTGFTAPASSACSFTGSSRCARTSRPITGSSSARSRMPTFRPTMPRTL